MELSLRERDRLSVLRQASEGVLTRPAAAARLGVMARHLRRLMRRFEAEGDAAAVHGLKGRRSNRALPAASDPLYADFGPTLLAEHLDRRFGLVASPDTLRRWMLGAGLWERRRRRARHRSRRPRRAALGELGQWDSSVHPWLEERAAGSQTLISIHDDATSRLLMARFAPCDNGAENRRAIIAYLRLHGRPVAVHTDHAGHFGQWLSKKEERTGTIISRGLGALGIEVIPAGSPQANGRVERSFGTAQDRLVKEMRVGGIATLEAANLFLGDYWVPFWNERFAVEPADPRDAHRPLPPGADLDALFAETETRVMARDFTIRFRNRRWQIPEREAEGIAPGDGVVVERRLDVEPAGRRPVEDAPRPRPAKPRPAPPKPGPDHRWRRHFQESVRRAIARRDLRREREAISNGTEPPRTPEPARERATPPPRGRTFLLRPCGPSFRTLFCYG